MSQNKANYILASGAVDALRADYNDRRFFLIEQNNRPSSSREAFETEIADLMGSSKTLTRTKGGEYKNLQTFDMWIGWSLCNAYLQKPMSEGK